MPLKEKRCASPTAKSYRYSIFTLPSDVWMVSGVPPPFSFPRNSWPSPPDW